MNTTKLKSVLCRAAAGEELTIGFLGGSITQGSLTTQPENTYAYRVYRWWCETFPQAKFHYVNGGIGGTDSLYGVSRAVTDLLMYQPDFVVLDFSVNDTRNTFCQETYEGAVRRILSWPSRPALVLLHNIYYDSGLTTEAQHGAVGDWYALPRVSVQNTIYRQMKDGQYTMQQLTPDGLHPNDFGHGLVAEEITKLLADVNAQRDEPEAESPLPAPLTANAYENAQRLTLREACPALHGFRADTREKAWASRPLEKRLVCPKGRGFPDLYGGLQLPCGAVPPHDPTPRPAGAAGDGRRHRAPDFAGRQL